jgi:organic hydroperoxide reductase OsmC/OhrA
VRIRADDDVEQATHLHHVAHQKCYIANSVNFPILCEPVVKTDAR